MTRDNRRRRECDRSDDDVIALLPFYVSKQLDSSERAEVDRWAAHSPAARRAVENAQIERAAVVAANEDITPPAGARARLDAAIDALAPRPHGIGKVKRAWQFVAGFFEAGHGRLAWGVAALLLAVAVAQATYLVQRSEPARYGLAGGDSASAVMADATVIFAPDAAMAKVTALLRENGARIVAGPDGSTAYRIAIAVDHAGGTHAARIARIEAARNLIRVFTTSTPARRD